MILLFTFVGVLLDVMLQLFVLLAASAPVAAVVRGEPDEQWVELALLLLLFLAGAIAGMVVLVRRILARERVVAVVRGGSEEVSTITWLHFVCDALFIAATAMMLRAATPPQWDSATRAGLIVCLALSLGLCAVRAVTRARGD